MSGVTASRVFIRSPRAHVAEIVVRGELDASTGRLLQDAFDTQVDDASVQTLSLHLADVTFVDSSGLRVLIRARRAARLVDRSLVLTAPSPSVRRLLEITGIRELFTIV
jgi:anti-anti-sigma factor